MKLLEIAKKAPHKPGVYKYLDKDENILYIGRATSLRSRLKQYFQKQVDDRIKEMVLLADNIEYIETASVLEAIILEANLIKKYWPKYNVKDKDDRSFSYLIIDKRQDFPKPVIVRGRELKKFISDKVAVFGPYQSQYLLRRALKLIRQVFPYSTCEPNSARACFDYQIGLCPGVCISEISSKEYKKNIEKIVMLLKGERTRLIKTLKKENPEQVEALKNLQEVTLLQKEKDLKTPELSRIEAYDISHLSAKEAYGSMVVFTNNEIDKSQYRLFKISEENSGDDLHSMLEVLSRRLKHLEWPRPDIILLDGGKPQVDFLSHYFDENNITIPLVGLSKYGGDVLVFRKGTNKSVKELIKLLKPKLQELREEAHRFCLQASKKRRRIK
ncbi:GIY-YIG nuclease family protein [Patescibacteria group bacterium]|nr:GIY-YIG nuclease family protein [Patescibacteria group bacterium]